MLRTQLFAVTGGSFNQHSVLQNLWPTFVPFATRTALLSLVPLDLGHLKLKKRGNTNILEGISAYITLHYETQHFRFKKRQRNIYSLSKQRETIIVL